MKNRIISVSLLSSLLFVCSVQAKTVNYKLDESHTSVVISWNHLGFSNPTASIHQVDGVVKFDPKTKVVSLVDINIPTTSIDTGVSALNKEFGEADYFDTTHYPVAHFKSTQITMNGNQYDVYGNLTIKSITKPIILHAMLNKSGFQGMEKKNAVGFNATGVIKRSDFKIDKYVPYVSDEIKISISSEAYSE
ncbi:polyisoprenoid-binding protein [Klebsiella sp. JL973]|uniref:Protein YceI n=1 Tax=Thelohanellus kitauei TaxID=669202 RepID=A0A0C2N8Z3_THEKT|nr:MULTISPECIES: YceI family protein [Klebsiella]KII72815.1 Protein YceI [Thelohanellus kitauei]HDH7817920.1 polyisoprenoid-binding protein [Raoultella ornithinolytica]HDS8778800.1 polyisoprenoid-binding protein [Klebsiella michiganensis]MBW6032945.1 polyisoprenoid-binding protein [Klebsiella sp. CVUAS 11332]MBZ7674837.1 polyisoprenoid-binding protein [Klebsiella grimontii]